MIIPKFRAWHKAKKVMLPVRQIRFDFEMIVVDLPLGGGTSTISRGASVVFDEIELMQFTGCHDEAGDDIYDGDILDMTMQDDIEKTTATVMFINDGFKLVGATYTGDELYPQTRGIWGKIIGNIHQNPELLEKA